MEKDYSNYIKTNVFVYLTSIFVSLSIIIPHIGSLPSRYFLPFLLALIALYQLLSKKDVISIDRNSKYFLIWMALFLAPIVISLFYVRGFEATRSYINVFLVAILIYTLFKYSFHSRTHIFIMFKIYILMTSIVALLTTFAYICYIYFDYRSDLLFIIKSWDIARVQGFIGNPNYYAASVILGVSFLLALLHYRAVPIKPGYAILIFLSLNIVMSYSRGALLSLLVILLVYFAVHFSPVQFRKTLRYLNDVKRIIKLVLIIVITLAGIVLLKDTTIIENLTNQVTTRVMDVFQSDTKYDSRYELWVRGFDVYTSSLLTLFLGVGGNNFELYHEFGVDNHPHNNYLRLLYEHGLIGVVIFTILLYWIASKVFDLKKRKVISPLIYGFVSYCVFSLSNDMFIIREFWVVVALILIWDNLSQIELTSGKVGDIQ